MLSRSVLIVLATALLGACGRDTPTAPTPAPVSRIALSAERNTILTSETVRVTARATRTDGSETIVTPTWAVDDRLVAIIQPNGDVTGLSHGQALIVATYGGTSASLPLHVIANYRGTWSGPMTAVACRFWDPRTCGRSILGQTETATVQVDQSGAVVQAVLTRPSGSRAELTGRVTDAGVLELSGHFFVVRPSGEVVRSAEVIGWRTRVSTIGTLMGEFTSALESEFFPLVVTYELRGLTRGTP